MARPRKYNTYEEAKAAHAEAMSRYQKTAKYKERMSSEEVKEKRRKSVIRRYHKRALAARLPELLTMATDRTVDDKTLEQFIRRIIINYGMSELRGTDSDLDDRIDALAKSMDDPALTDDRWAYARRFSRKAMRVLNA